MKILQNPIVVAILVVVAVALIFKQIASNHSMRHAPTAAAASPAVAAPTSTPPPQPAKTTSNPVMKVNAVPEASIDEPAAEASAERAARTPRRDPFQHKTLSTNQAKAFPSARQLLALKGVWLQTGSALAVINNQVTGVGNSVLEFKVESIESDRVWVTGPSGREAVEFGSTPPASPANPQTNSVPQAKH